MNAMAVYPRYFRPAGTGDLIRIGAANDGGYVIPERIVAASQGLLSFGLSDDCSFEVDFAGRAQCPVVCFDHTVDGQFWVVRTLSNLAKAVMRFEPKRLGYAKRWVDYQRFFGNGRNRHVRRAIGYGVANSATFNEAVEIAQFDGRYFLKIDIEGWEYRVLDDIVTAAPQMTGVAIELHDIDLHQARIQEFLTTISQHMALVHFHPNSAMQLGRDGTSIVAELTFLNRDLLGPEEELRIEDLPLPGVDAPNEVDGVDPPVRFA
jgi:hypothetical protein